MAKTRSSDSGDVLEMKPDKRTIHDFNRKFVYHLAEENSDMVKVYDAKSGQQIKGPKYREYTNLILRSSIIWDGADYVENEDGGRKKGHPAGLRMLRYYDGCTSIFMDEQPQDLSVIKQAIQQTRPRFFQRGYLEIFGHEIMFKYFLDICSQNALSPYRVGTTPALFQMADSEALARRQAEKMDREEEAMKLAKEASVKHMRVHCSALLIGDVDFITGYPLTDEAIRTEYRKAAKEDPENFIKSYSDKTIEIQFWVRRAIENGHLSTVKIPNKLCWAKNGQVIMDVSGIQDPAEIIKKATEYSQLFDGAEFLSQLKSMNQ